MIKTFDFSVALELMRVQRAKVRRAHWTDRRIYVVGDRFYCRFDDDDAQIEYTLMSSDILAQDWRVDLLPGEGVQQKLGLVWAD